MPHENELEVANKALFEALLAQGCSAVQAARIANESDAQSERPPGDLREREEDATILGKSAKSG